MDAQFEEFWNSPEHAAFVEELDGKNVRALRDVLLLAALADDMFTLQERAELTAALGNASGLGDSLEFQKAAVIDHIDDLYVRFERRGEALLVELVEQVGEEHREHALRASVVLMATHGFVESEEAFALHLADLMGIDEARYQEIISDVAL